MKGWIGVHLTPLDIYPVGSIYLSTAATNPGALFGGTWQAIEGRFLLAAGGGYNAGSTGGEAARTLTIEEMPEHTHQIGDGFFKDLGGYGVTGSMYKSTLEPTDEAVFSRTSSSGGGKPHNNLPPYLAVYVWKRTA